MVLTYIIIVIYCQRNIELFWHYFSHIGRSPSLACFTIVRVYTSYFASTLLLWEGCGACAPRIILGSHWVRSLPVSDTTSFYPILIHRKRSGCRDAISVPSGKSFSFLLQSLTHCRIPPHRLSVPRRLTSHFLAGWQPIVLSHMPVVVVLSLFRLG